ncbi:hypothetical protein ACFOZ0_01615 [Streptomyces yaanensis]|uniref:Uncharacterized protein n=1 Tax=Streptomyces yaanensis TaxID=1142239 RepID=A0ABV7S4J3_9ACTN|nr:hypothetical protein [Streptomyces sp. CGMCC 4.7035]WNB99601.1 hypothetical protein Q2K21_16835 [Streptomyces sp. CGMCC 4.7035]
MGAKGPGEASLNDDDDAVGGGQDFATGVGQVEFLYTAVAWLRSGR